MSVEIHFPNKTKPLILDEDGFVVYQKSNWSRLSNDYFTTNEGNFVKGEVSNKTIS